MNTSPATSQDGSVTEGRGSSQEPEAVESTKPQPDLPPKPLSVLEDNRKKGFFPISWRVIGGGVMMGGQRECLYCQHPTRSTLRKEIQANTAQRS
jgi:hypothetical protein